MNKAIIVGAVALLALSTTPKAHAIGCLSGAAVGAIMGHQAHHGIIGAGAGCIIGHEIHRAVERYKANHDGQSPSLSDLKGMLPSWISSHLTTEQVDQVMGQQ